MDSKRPEFAMPTGVARSARAEVAALKLTVLDLDLDNESLERAASVILSSCTALHGKKPENELRVKEGTVYINRLRGHHKEEMKASQAAAFDVPEVVRQGLETTLRFHESSTKISLSPEEVLVDVQAVGVNPEVRQIDIPDPECNRN